MFEAAEEDPLEQVPHQLDIKPLKLWIANSTLPSFTRFLNPIDSPMFHLAMGWNCSAHVSFRNGLEMLRPCFISQWAGIAPPMLHSFCLVIRGWDASWFNLSTRLGHQLMSFLDMFHLAMLPWLFVFRCGLEFRAICIFLWLGVPSYLYFALAWSSELSSSICT